jgi:hypothetical protein
MKALEASYRDACTPGPDQYLHPLHEITLRAFGSKVMAALRVAAGVMSNGRTPSPAAAAAAAAVGYSQPLVAMFCSAMQQQQQGSATAEEPTEQQQQQQVPKRLYSLLVSVLKGLLLSNGDTAAGDIRLMLGSVDAAELAVQLCKAAASSASNSSSSSSRGVLSAQQVSPWMALAARGVTTAIETHVSLMNENAPGLAEIKRSSTADAIEMETARKPDAPLERLLPVDTWLLEQLQQHQQALGVPAELVAELQQILSYVQMALPAAMMGLCMSVNEAAMRAGTVNSVGGAEMGNAMHRIAMPVLAQTPHAYACNNPGVLSSLLNHPLFCLLALALLGRVLGIVGVCIDACVSVASRNWWRSAMLVYSSNMSAWHCWEVATSSSSMWRCLCWRRTPHAQS